MTALIMAKSQNSLIKNVVLKLLRPDAVNYLFKEINN